MRARSRLDTWIITAPEYTFAQVQVLPAARIQVRGIFTDVLLLTQIPKLKGRAKVCLLLGAKARVEDEGENDSET